MGMNYYDQHPYLREERDERLAIRWFVIKWTAAIVVWLSAALYLVGCASVPLEFNCHTDMECIDVYGDDGEGGFGPCPDCEEE
jgi:hypothetical protein